MKYQPGVTTLYETWKRRFPDLHAGQPLTCIDQLGELIADQIKLCSLVWIMAGQLVDTQSFDPTDEFTSTFRKILCGFDTDHSVQELVEMVEHRLFWHIGATLADRGYDGNWQLYTCLLPEKDAYLLALFRRN